VERVPAVEWAPGAEHAPEAGQEPQVERPASQRASKDSHTSKGRGRSQPSEQPRTAAAGDAADDEPARTNSGGADTAPTAPPDPVTDAQTVILPKLGTSQAKAHNGSAADNPSDAPADPPDSVADAQTVIPPEADSGQAKARNGSAVQSSDAPAGKLAAVGPPPADAGAAAAPASPAGDGSTPQAGRPARDRAPRFQSWFQPWKQPRPGNASDAPTGTSPAENEPPAPKAPPARKTPRSSQFGMAPAVRPDVLTDAETVVLPALDKGRSKPSKVSLQPGLLANQAPAGGGVLERHGGDSAMPALSASALAEAVTQILSAVAAPVEVLRHKPEPARQPGEAYTPTRRRTRVSRTVLLGILCLQAIMSLRLRNTAFQDEALYLYSGHLELEHLLHGGTLYGNFSSYFAGAPILYPVAAAALNQVGGLALARALSLIEMLAVTAIVYSITRRLFNERAALCAVALFSVTETAIFLGNFATYDATCLFLLAVTAWIMVYTARSRWPLFFLAVPVATLAVAVKYAGVLWVPTIALLPPLTAWPDRIRRAWLSPICFLVAVGDLLFAALRLGGHAYMTAVKATTTNRGQGPIPVATILTDSARWGGLMFAVAVVGSVAYVYRVRTEPDEQLAPAGSRLRRASLGLVLTGTVLLAPAYAAYLHSVTSLQEQIGFGLFFAAPMAGVGLVRIMGDHFRWPHLGVAIWSVALVFGLVQSSSLYHGWPPSGTFVSAFSRYLKPNARYLVEVPEVPIYYLEDRSDAQAKQFTSTYSVAPLSTPASFATAVKDKEFQVIAYNGDVTPANDNALAKALKASRSYYLASKVYIGFAYGSGEYYYIWVEGAPPKAHSTSGAAGKSHVVNQ
jgi:Dolichyl-phosphate-mannose-protein mannosyltransferase